MEPLINLAARLQSFGAIGAFILFLIKATLILGVVRLLLLALPRASAATKHFGITLALGSILVIPIAGFFVPSWSLPLLPSAERVNVDDGIGVTGNEEETPTALDAAITVARATGVVPQARINAISDAVQGVKNSWQGLLLLAIFGVSAVLLLRMFAGILGVAKVIRTAEEVRDDEALLELDAARDHLQLARDVRLLRSARTSMPVVWGLFKPVLLLPASSAEWTRERMRVVMLHELAHVKRYDGLTLLLTRAAVALFWFHPMMWTLERMGRAECERACDDLALSTGTRPSDYAEHLLAIARALPHADPFRSVTLAMTRRSQLEGRLLSILQPNARRGTFSGRLVGAFVVTAVLVLIPVAAMRVVAAPPEGGREPIVEIGPSFAAKVDEAPEMLLAQFEKIKNKNRNVEPATGREWYEKGMEYHHSDRYAEAIAAFKFAIDAGYRVDGSKYNIACGYALMGDRDQAMKWLRDSIDAGYDSYDHIAEDSDLDSLRADREFQALLASIHDGDERPKDRMTEVLEEYAELQSDRNADGDDWFDAGLNLLSLRQMDPAIEAFEKALEMGEKTSTTMYNLACAYSLKGDVAQAEQWLQRAIQEGFDNVDKLKNDPDLKNLRQSPRFAAMVSMSEDLRLQSGWKGPKWFFGDSSEESWREMLPRYEEMTRKYPDNGRSFFNLGYAQLQAGQNEAAAQSFLKASSLGYRPGASNYNAACAFAKAGNNNRAFEQLQKARSVGFKLSDYLEDDDDLENLYGDPRFLDLRKQVRAEERTYKDK